VPGVRSTCAPPGAIRRAEVAGRAGGHRTRRACLSASSRYATLMLPRENRHEYGRFRYRRPGAPEPPMIDSSLPLRRSSHSVTPGTALEAGWQVFSRRRTFRHVDEIARAAAAKPRHFLNTCTFMEASSSHSPPPLAGLESCRARGAASR